MVSYVREFHVSCDFSLTTVTTVRVEADDGEEYDSPSSLATIEPKSETRLDKGKSKAVDLPNDSESSIPASLPTIEPKAETSPDKGKGKAVDPPNDSESSIPAECQESGPRMDKGKGKMVDLKCLTEGLSKGIVRADFGHAENPRGRPAMHGEMDKQHQRMRETGEAKCEGMSQIQSKSSMLTLSVLI
jgi:hypothetical protein